MSEYQYYEFQALDRPLSDAEMRLMRSVSTRATITATRFVNHYEWGDFKGDVREWMKKYFDAFVYVANWGAREFMLRLPRKLLDPKLARRYCVGEAASVLVEKDFVILIFDSEDDEGGEEWDDGSGRLSALVPLRADLVRGDHRALYLAWLLCVQRREVDDDAAEPPVPPGLATLSAPLRAMADSLRIDRSLIAVAAERSTELAQADPPEALADWISTQPLSVKNDWLMRLTRAKSCKCVRSCSVAFGNHRVRWTLPLSPHVPWRNCWTLQIRSRKSADKLKRTKPPQKPQGVSANRRRFAKHACRS